MAATREHESLESYRDTKPQIGTQAGDENGQARESPVLSPRDYLQRAQQLLRHLIHRKPTTGNGEYEKEVVGLTPATPIVPGFYEAPTTPLRQAAEESRAYCQWCAQELEAPVQQQPVELEVPYPSAHELASDPPRVLMPRSDSPQVQPNWPLGSVNGQARRDGPDGAAVVNGDPRRTLTTRPAPPSSSSYGMSSHTWSG
ncbi:hypothetical protein BKA80DRAFT_17997 [Phyllosticta citrichinensis]